AACHHGVTFWDTGTGRQVLTLGDKGRPLAFSPDGRFVALGDDTGKVELRELCSLRTLWKWQAHPAAIRDLTFTAGGRRRRTHRIGVGPLRPRSGRETEARNSRGI